MSNDADCASFSDDDLKIGDVAERTVAKGEIIADGGADIAILGDPVSGAEKLGELTVISGDSGFVSNQALGVS